jgi:A/G-specific adenine glycosylase
MSSGRRRRIQLALLGWYRPRSRPLRIRSTTDPWALLVAEVMAQQTQIARVDEAWAVFMERYPAPHHLASVSTAEVLRAWAGLGYNRRALNLQRTARAIESEHAGVVPSDIETLQTLPGIGPYTSRALAATAFGQPVAAVDTNVRRVVSRVLGEPLSPAGLQVAADALVYEADPATWTHASMDLGATVCRPRRPRCDECPVRQWCASAGKMEQLPRAESGSRLPFEQTSRWLRGRIVERLRALNDDAWTRLPAVIGSHDEQAVVSAIAGLEQDGLLERSPDGSVRLPSSHT